MKYNTIKNLLGILGVLLFIQFWLGMVINLFANIPDSTPLSFFGYSGGLEVLAHISNGILILIVSVILLPYSIKLTGSNFSRLSIIGSIFIVAAIISGFTFILLGMNNSFSIAMAMTFLSIYTVYFFEFYLVGRAEVADLKN